ncbi:endonuclease/exonuclease/phosphatase family protein [uncultured Jatrophihabitans sp.]|uniref:endonuclease/exonuclease/phosphatase family protein n=1 Tax=uncultured Jatrophihabitans sp. TaxID=1610747 RepID=UPI0035CA1B73
MAGTTRIASFNIRTSTGTDGWNRWWFRRPACVAAIRGFGADVVGLQEVRPGQLRGLRRAFSTWMVVGEGRDADGGGEHAAVLIAPDSWTVESSDTRWLSATPDRPGSRGWDAGHPRIVTLVRLRRGNTVLGVANTHFDHRGPDSRRKSAALLAGWLGAEPDRPWVITGDLNATPTSPPLTVLREAGYADTLPVDAGGTEHAFTGAQDRKRIDYVLTGPGVDVTSAWIGHERPHGRLPSDHWPVVADLSID